MTNKSTHSKSRRNFLRVGAAGAGIVALGALGEKSLPGVAGTVKAAPNVGYKRVVIVNLLGGNDGLNTVVPINNTTHPSYQSERPTIHIPAGTALGLSGTSDWGLHPSLTNLQGLYNSGSLAVIQKVGYQNANLSHFVSEDIWSTGVRGGMSSLGSTAPGWIARFRDLETETSPGVYEPLGVVALGVGRRLDFAGSQADSLIMRSLGSFNYDMDWNYRRNHELRLETVANILAAQPDGDLKETVARAAEAGVLLSGQIRQAGEDYDTALGTTYPDNRLGRQLKDIARLMYGGFNTRIYYTGYGGFDTHSGQAARHDSLMAQLDGGLGAFVGDLQTMGVWNDTVVVVISEFGRRNFENGSDGTDHGHGSCMFVLGGPVNGGIYGTVDDAEINSNNYNYLPYDTDFRVVYGQVLASHLGVGGTIAGGGNLGQIFPEAPESGKGTSPGAFI